jgi:transcriptional repressor NrdR
VEDALRLTVIKKDGSREPYDREKVIHGLQRACYKRAVSDEQIRSIVEATEEDIFKSFEKEVPSSFIGDTVSRRLRETDQIAYVRFASVYRDFEDLGELIDEAQGMRGETDPGPQQKKLFEHGRPEEP